LVHHDVLSTIRMILWHNHISQISENLVQILLICSKNLSMPSWQIMVVNFQQEVRLFVFSQKHIHVSRQLSCSVSKPLLNNPSLWTHKISIQCAPRFKQSAKLSSLLKERITGGDRTTFSPISKTCHRELALHRNRPSLSTWGNISILSMLTARIQMVHSLSRSMKGSLMLWTISSSCSPWYKKGKIQ